MAALVLGTKALALPGALLRVGGITPTRAAWDKSFRQRGISQGSRIFFCPGPARIRAGVAEIPKVSLCVSVSLCASALFASLPVGFFLYVLLNKYTLDFST